MDVQVYGTDHSMRLYGSCKRVVGRPFKIMGRKINHQLFKQSLIRLVDVEHYIIDSWGGRKEEREGIKRVRYSNQEVEWKGWSTDQRETMAENLCKLIKKKYNRKTAYVKWLGNRIAINLRPGIKCPIQQRVHKSNSSSAICTVPIVYSDSMVIRVKVICQDSDCEKCVLDNFELYATRK